MAKEEMATENSAPLHFLSLPPFLLFLLYSDRQRIGFSFLTIKQTALLPQKNILQFKNDTHLLSHSFWGLAWQSGHDLPGDSNLVSFTVIMVLPQGLWSHLKAHWGRVHLQVT